MRSYRRSSHFRKLRIFLPVAAGLLRLPISDKSPKLGVSFGPHSKTREGDAS